MFKLFLILPFTTLIILLFSGQTYATRNGSQVTTMLRCPLLYRCGCKNEAKVLAEKEDEAKEEFKKEMITKYNRTEPFSEIEFIVKEIIIVSIVQIDNK